MQQGCQLKRLGAGDNGALRQLNEVFARAFSEPETYLRKPPGDEYLNTWLANEHNIALVALDAGTVTAGLVAYVLDKFEQQRQEVYIYDLAVAEEHRRSGVATALIRRLQEIGKEIG